MLITREYSIGMNARQNERDKKKKTVLKIKKKCIYIKYIKYILHDELTSQYKIKRIMLVQSDTQ